MTVADLARKAAIAIELKKDGLSQRQNGDWVLRFTVQAADMDQRLVMAAMGQRFQAALVMIGDDELPIEQPEEPTEIIVKERTPWRELQPTAQSVLRCKEPSFHVFLRENYGAQIEGEADAATFVRKHCGVNSRSTLSNQPNAGEKWLNMDSMYQAWQRVGA